MVCFVESWFMFESRQGWYSPTDVEIMPHELRVWWIHEASNDSVSFNTHYPNPPEI